MKRIIILLAVLFGFGNGIYAQTLNVVSTGCGSYCFTLQGNNPNIVMGDSVLVDIMWGDGQMQSVLANSFTTVYQMDSVCHTYTSNGTYRAVFYVHHNNVLIDSVDTMLTVNCVNTQPSVNVTINSVSCNQYCFNIQGSDSAITSSDSVTVFFDWGDGQNDTYTATVQNGSFSLSAACHNYSADSTYSVTILIQVNGQIRDTLTQTISVDCSLQGSGNATLTLTSASCDSFCVSVEGMDSLIVMGDSVMVNIVWGDGQSQTEPASAYTTFYQMNPVCHTYASDGTYQLLLYIYHQGNLIDSVGRTITVNCITTQLMSEKNEITIYPNPVRDILKIESSSSEFSQGILLDIQGRLVKKTFLQGSNNEWNLSELLPGTYILQLYRKDGSVQMFRVVKE